MAKEGIRNKIARNDPCPCGSGKKYKKCHGRLSSVQRSRHQGEVTEAEIKRKVAELEARQKQREQQQGLGRPIISTFFKGYRFVAVGSAMHWSKNWKTFHDFLFDYIRKVFGSEWGNAELKKTFEDRHPVIQWYDLICRYQKETISNPGQVHTAPGTGAVAAYLGLAYNLYLLAHNAKIQQVLIDRLKNRDQFSGAYYETFVAAIFIKAGFDLEFENEADGTKSHCEFKATYRETGANFSVEAKARVAGKSHADVGNQLYNALLKEANHTRVVFIDVNVPDDASQQHSISYIEETLAGLRGRESSLTIHGNPAPEAYIIVTNHPYEYSLKTSHFRVSALAEGFKMPEFKIGAKFSSIRAALRAREKHHEMFTLMDSIREHYEIPSTFDGEIPELAFGKTETRLRIGKKYLVLDDKGKEVVGELVEATVAWDNAVGIYRLEDGRSIIAKNPLTEDELSAYDRYPDTFFGVYKTQGRKAETPLELFDFFYETYQKTPKEKLLEFLKDHPDFEKLQGESQEELAIIYCERMAYVAFSVRE